MLLSLLLLSAANATDAAAAADTNTTNASTAVAADYASRHEMVWRFHVTIILVIISYGTKSYRNEETPFYCKYNLIV